MGNYKFYKSEVDSALEFCKSINERLLNIKQRDEDQKHWDANIMTVLNSLSSLALGTVNTSSNYQDLSKSSELVTQRLKEIEVSVPQIDGWNIKDTDNP
jgi:hypothetical protein